MDVSVQHIKMLNRFTACVALVMDMEYNSLRGITDPDGKKYCCYLAKKILMLDDGLIATYYKINVGFMRKCLNDVEITKLVYDSLEFKFLQVRLFWNTAIGNDILNNIENA